ncbi:hypothetical protein, partial [Thermoflexus hugenholtzii]
MSPSGPHRPEGRRPPSGPSGSGLGFPAAPELILRPHVETAALAIWAPRSAARLQEQQEAFPTDRIDGYRLQVGA